MVAVGVSTIGCITVRAVSDPVVLEKLALKAPDVH